MSLGEEFEDTGAELVKVNGHPPSVPVINSAVDQQCGDQRCR